MPRTPLLSSLRELARDHRIAAEAQLPVDAVREKRAESRINRRQFLAGSAATAATIALARPRLARASGQPRIAIVGAGISGLNAALTLADAGLASTVYEAGGRVGGRMFSNMNGYWNDGQVSEWCGELIDTQHKTVQSLAKRFNLPLTDLAAAEPNHSTDTYYFFNRFYSVADADSDFQVIHQALQKDVSAANYPTLYNSSTAAGRALDSMSVYDWIESRVPGGHSSPLGQLLDVAYNIEYGAETRDQSALNLVYLLGFQESPGSFNLFGRSDERYHIEGGNQRLPLAIANYLGNVQLGQRLVALAQSSSGAYTLTFQSGNKSNTVTADYVILTLPFAVLRDLDYSKAGFDAQKNNAIQNLGRGRNGKLQLQFSDRTWYGPGAWGIGNGLSYADTGYQNTWEVSRGQAGASGILVDYTGGNVTLAMSTRVAFTTAVNSDAVSDARRFLGQIEPIYSGLSSRWNGKVTSSLPHLDGNFKCSYSYWRVGQYQTISGYERVPQGNVFFGGEHTSQDFQGFMEGGAEEGARAAGEVLTAMGQHAALPSKIRIG